MDSLEEVEIGDIVEHLQKINEQLCAGGLEKKLTMVKGEIQLITGGKFYGGGDELPDVLESLKDLERDLEQLLKIKNEEKI